MNRREALGVMGAAGLSPTLLGATIPENKENNAITDEPVIHGLHGKLTTWEDLEYWEHPPFLRDITKTFVDKEKMMSQIENEVLEWLKEDGGDGILEYFFYDTNSDFIPDILLFSRCEIHIKRTRNSWEVWRIATSTNYPKMISYKVRHVGTNQYGDHIVLPNEVRCQEYSTENQNERWNIINKDKMRK